MTKFTGFDEPTENWSKLPHALINNLHLMTSESEIKVVLYILRHTWGYGDDQKKITIDEFSKGRKRKDGSRLDNGLGISENSIREGIAKAIEHGFIEVQEDSSDKARIKRHYSLRGSGSGVQKLNPRGSEVEPQPSEVEPRSEKDTTRETHEKETSSCGDDAKWSAIQTAYQNNISISVSPIVVDEMKHPDYMVLPVEWWVEAITIAAANGKRTWAYVRGVLDRSRDSGVSPKKTGAPKPFNAPPPEQPKPKFTYTPTNVKESTR